MRPTSRVLSTRPARGVISAALAVALLVSGTVTIAVASRTASAADADVPDVQGSPVPTHPASVDEVEVEAAAGERDGEGELELPPATTVVVEVAGTIDAPDQDSPVTGVEELAEPTDSSALREGVQDGAKVSLHQVEPPDQVADATASDIQATGAPAPATTSAVPSPPAPPGWGRGAR